MFKGQRRLHGQEVNIRSGDMSLGEDRRPASPQSWKAVSRQAALTTASPEAHLNLAPRVWQEEANQAVSMNPPQWCQTFTQGRSYSVGSEEAAIRRCLVSPCCLSCLH